ncbi:hypothetical protein H5V45_12925 [Nocardioides sp. KIGAM211]|uniref:Uncharacterized protein n=1 Tax=Nocardioides luti TaxID=2761101 RepID=A0A7X0RH53_9ACTN|nr:hypothetical protein [Nocardioides luti]MBB6628224.1 hypothetical protein [Nocardioides luti]
MPTAAAPTPLADQLLDLQVAHHLDRLKGKKLDATVTRLAGSLLDASGRHQIEDLVDRAAIKAIVTRAMATVPGSAAVSGILQMAVQVVHDGPATPYPLGDLAERDQVEALVDAVLGLAPVLERALERLTASPLVGTIASRFMGRIVGEVLQANKAVADKVPGLGSLMSFGTSAASRVMGAADKQFEGLINDTVGKSGTFAVRRLNKIVIETLQDPTTREAVLQVWDLAATQEVRGLGEQASYDELVAVVDAVHDVAISALSSEQVARIGDVVVDAFFERFGGYTPTELLDELDLDRDELVADLVRMAPRVVDALRASGDLEQIVRAELAPFYASAKVRKLLG